MLIYNVTQHVKNILANNAVTDYQVHAVAMPSNPTDKFILCRETGGIVGQLGLHLSLVNYQIAGYTKSDRRRLETVMFTLYDNMTDKYQITMPQPSGMVSAPADKHAQFLRRTNRPTFVTTPDGWLCYVFTAEVFYSEN